MKHIRFFKQVLAVLVLGFVFLQAKAAENKFVQLSIDLLESVKEEGDYSVYTDKMKSLSLDELSAALDNDNKTKAFWINTYNAYIQILLKETPSLFDDRNAFFKAKQINIGGELVSFDLIEHGIIRGSKVKLSLGYLKDPFASSFEKKFRVEETDGRIHFSLNCGAKSCPYVATYTATNLDAELDKIAKQFLNRTTTYKPEEDKVYVTTLFNWFRGDFSDKGGVIGFLHKYKVIPQSAEPDVAYKDYDWTLDLGNYTTI